MALPRLLSGRRRIRFFYLVANGIGQAAVAVVSALLVQRGFDSLIAGGEALSLRTSLIFGGGLMTAILVGAWLRWRGHVDAEQLGQGYIHAVRMKLFRHIARIGADGARQMSRGAMMLRFVGDLTALRQWISLGLARLTVGGLSAVLALGALAFFEPVIAIAVGVSVAGAGALALAIGPKLRGRTREARRRRGRLAGTLNNRITHIGVVEAFGQEARERDRIEGLSRSLRHALVRRARIVGLLRALSEASASFAGLCALFVGAFLVGMGLATPGAVVAAMVVAGLLAPSIQDLGRVYEYWNNAVIARRKQEQLLALKAVGRHGRRAGRKSLEDGPGRLELRDVSRHEVIEHVSVRLEKGERLGIVGRNGAGKSTLLRLIAGILHPSAGKVLLDGQNINDVNWRDLRQAFAMVSPDLPLLRGSLRFNLTYGARNVSDEDLARVLEACGLTPLIERLPQGVRTRVSESGDELSTGERARVALARALLVRPRVLLFDEAEANLDRVARTALDRIMDDFDGTIVFTTHTRERAARADRIIHLEAGRAVAIGPPDQLLAEGEATAAVFHAPLRVVSGPAAPQEPGALDEALS